MTGTGSIATRCRGRGGSSRGWVDELGWPECTQSDGVADQRRELAARRHRDPAHHRVGLRVHPRRVQWIVPAGDAQEAGALLERLRRRAWAPP